MHTSILVGISCHARQHTHVHVAIHTSRHGATHTSIQVCKQCHAHQHSYMDTLPCTPASTQCCAPQHVRMHTVPCTPVQISTVLCTQRQARRCTPADVCTQCHAHQCTQSCADQHSPVLSVPSTAARRRANRALHTSSRRAVPHSNPTTSIPTGAGGAGAAATRPSAVQ